MSDYEVRKGVPIIQSKRTGLTEAIRALAVGDCLIIPGGQISSIHPCAANAGVKVKTHKNEDGTVTAWRVDEPRSALMDTDIFGNPWPQVPAPLNPLSQPETKNIFE